jgi:hypothetical protein
MQEMRKHVGRQIKNRQLRKAERIYEQKEQERDKREV